MKYLALLLVLLCSCSKESVTPVSDGNAGILEYDSLAFWTISGPHVNLHITGDYLITDGPQELRLVTDGLIYRTEPPMVRVRIIYGGTHNAWSLTPLQTVGDSIVIVKYGVDLYNYTW